MSNGKKPGETSGRDGGIYREVGPRGGKHDNWVTVPDRRTLPPTQNPGSTWHRERRTPDSKR